MAAIAGEKDVLLEVNHMIDGTHRPASSGERFESIDPTSGQPWAQVADGTAADVDAAVKSSRAALEGEWGQMSPTRRGRALMRFADAITRHASEIAVLETRDNGKLLREMEAQLSVVPDWLYYFGGLADKVEGRVIPLDRTSIFNYTLREPLGVVGVITPWNSPTLIAMLGGAPALAAGNAVVLKPSEVASASSVKLAELALEAGIPPGVLNVVVGARTSGEAIVKHPGVAKVAFTGGLVGGRAVATGVGERLARCLLELGGKSANIVFPDADLDAAEAGMIAGIFSAGGQMCVAGSRAFVHRSVYDEFTARLIDRTQNIIVGDPMMPETQMGPVATEHQRTRVEHFIGEATAEGSEVLVGGSRLERPGLEEGFFYAPTIISGIKPDSRIAQEEIFGPVLTVTPFDTEDEVVALANGTSYGLAAGLWTTNLRTAHRVARRLEAGTVWINLYRAMTFNSPFGGYKNSGFGRENGIEAITEFLQTKSVWCELSEDIQDPFIIKV